MALTNRKKTVGEGPGSGPGEPRVPWAVAVYFVVMRCRSPWQPEEWARRRRCWASIGNTCGGRDQTRPFPTLIRGNAILRRTSVPLFNARPVIMGAPRQGRRRSPAGLPGSDRRCFGPVSGA